MSPLPDLRGPRPTEEQARWFLADFAELSAIGATPGGGVERQAASPADGQTRAWFARWLQTQGFEVHIDRIGNIFGLCTWTPGASYVIAGSHLDSQPLAGRWDGAYGVLAAAHAAVRLRDHVESTGARPPHNVGVVDWFNEEGSRFKPSMMGSGVYTGKLDLRAALTTEDLSGTTVETALEALGQRGDADVAMPAAYAEIHVEQGRQLEKDGTQIGVVHVTWAAQKYEVVVHGVQSHSGATAMEDRSDALYGAAMVVTAARHLTEEFGQRLRTSVSELHVLPNSPVVVAREVRLHLDLRSADAETVAVAARRMHEELRGIEVRAGVSIEARLAHGWDPMPYTAEGIPLAEGAAAALGLQHQRIATVAGHDSTNMKDRVPTVMLFVPSVDGIAHNEGELTRDADATAGVALLTEVLARLCHGALD